MTTVLYTISHVVKFPGPLKVHEHVWGVRYRVMFTYITPEVDTTNVWDMGAHLKEALRREHGELSCFD